MSSSDVKLTIQASDGCSELYLVDDKFKTVACAVGDLRAEVAPGLYKVRQRIGGNTHPGIAHLHDDRLS